MGRFAGCIRSKAPASSGGFHSWQKSKQSQHVQRSHDKTGSKRGMGKVTGSF